MRRECRERFPRHRLQNKRELAIPLCITARAWRTCCEAFRDRYPASFRVWQEAHGVMTSKRHFDLVKQVKYGVSGDFLEKA